MQAGEHWAVLQLFTELRMYADQGDEIKSSSQEAQTNFTEKQQNKRAEYGRNYNKI
jgi:hypothetical protein